MTATQSLLAVLLTPLLSAALIAFFCRRRGALAATLSVGAAAGIVVFTVMALRANPKIGVDRVTLGFGCVPGQLLPAFLQPAKPRSELR